MNINQDEELAKAIKDYKNCFDHAKKLDNEHMSKFIAFVLEISFNSNKSN